MKALWVTTTSMNLETITNSYPGEVYRYDVRNHLWEYHLEDKIRAVKPDLLILVLTCQGPFVIRPYVLFNVAGGVGNVVNICCDGSDPAWWHLLEAYREKCCVDFTVNIDGNENWLKGKRDMTLWCPNDPKPYVMQNEKSINLGWLGGDGSLGRRELIHALGDSLTVGKRSEELNSYLGYVDFITRCKSLLNIPIGGNGNLQMKNRVLEAGLANCCLFELKGSITSRYFEAGHDYVEYETAFDIKKMLDSESFEWPAYAANLNKKVREHYSAEIFWDRVLKNL